MVNEMLGSRLKAGARWLTAWSMRMAVRRLRNEFGPAKERWTKGLKGRDGWVDLIGAGIVFYGLRAWAFDQGVLFGVAFVMAAVLAILRGHIFTHPLQLVGVGVATVIAVQVIPDLRSAGLSALLRGEVIAGVVILAVMLRLRLLKQDIETGELWRGGGKDASSSRRTRSGPTKRGVKRRGSAAAGAGDSAKRR